MTNEELIALDKIGFVPGPGEEEEMFLARVARAKNKFEIGQWIPEAHWNWVHESLNEIFNVKPLYICAFYSNRSLTPWQGAASWIEGRALDSIQLRKELKKGSYLGIYSREEILAHEAVHAVRSGFTESRYEEFFAYMTSGAKWRRVLGPILQRPWEAWPFIGCLAIGMVYPLFFWGAVLWMGMGFWRLIQGHRTLARAAQILDRRVKDKRRTRAILLRLTDEEIEMISQGKELREDPSLRGRVIQHYFKEGYGEKGSR